MRIIVKEPRRMPFVHNVNQEVFKNSMKHGYISTQLTETLYMLHSNTYDDYNLDVNGLRVYGTLYLYEKNKKGFTDISKVNWNKILPKVVNGVIVL